MVSRLPFGSRRRGGYFGESAFEVARERRSVNALTTAAEVSEMYRVTQTGEVAVVRKHLMNRVWAVCARVFV